jgi:hypothetical protein
MCLPDNEPGYLMTVGESSYPTADSFLQEAHKLGISKRIAQIPRHMVLGETVIYLGHPNACGQDMPGIFMTFTPARIEQLVWESDMEKKKEELAKKGITAVGIKDGDVDHMPARPSQKHYHLAANHTAEASGIQWLTSYPTQAPARAALKALVARLRTDGLKLDGTLKDGYIEATTQASYCTIKCIDPTHLEVE